jgi:hypothetical protein
MLQLKTTLHYSTIFQCDNSWGIVVHHVTIPVRPSQRPVTYSIHTWTRTTGRAQCPCTPLWQPLSHRSALQVVAFCIARGRGEERALKCRVGLHKGKKTWLEKNAQQTCEGSWCFATSYQVLWSLHSGQVTSLGYRNVQSAAGQVH